MRRILFLTFFSSIFVFAATQEQVERYLSVSNAEEQILQMQSQFDKMQEMFMQKDKNITRYETQLIMDRFKRSIAKELSEDEMNEVLENYKNLLYLQFNSLSAQEPNFDDMDNYFKEARQSVEDMEQRVEIIRDITKYIVSKENLKIYFDDLIKPLYKGGKGAKNVDDNYLKKIENRYVKNMQSKSENEYLYLLRDMSTDELKQLDEFIKKSSVEMEIKADFRALSYALKEFFSNFIQSFNVRKHTIQR